MGSSDLKTYVNAFCLVFSLQFLSSGKKKSPPIHILNMYCVDIEGFHAIKEAFTERKDVKCDLKS